MLAAGLSTRMGQSKALLPWMGTTLVEYQLEQMAASRVSTVIVVVGHEAEAVSALGWRSRKGVKVVENRDYRQGRASSVVAGVREAATDSKALLLLNVDQPRPSWLIDEVVDAHLRGGAKITIPVHKGPQGPPNGL